MKLDFLKDVAPVQFSAKTLLVLFLLTLLMGGLVYYVIFVPHVEKDAPLRNALTPISEDVSFTNIEGEKVELTTVFGKTVLVYSWASWCPQCKEDLTVLDAYAASLPESADVTVLAINRAEDKYTAQRYLNALPDLPNIEIILDPNDQLFSAISGYAMPEYVLYDERGNTIFHGHGKLNTDAIKSALGEY